MRLSRWFRLQRHKQCGWGRHYPREPFQERQEVAAPSARCHCGRWVLFLLDGLSDHLGAAMVPDDAVPPGLFDADTANDDDTADDDDPMLDVGGPDAVEAWARIAWQQRAFLAALLHAQYRFMRPWTWLADGISALFIAAATYLVTRNRWGTWPLGSSWPRWVLVVGSILAMTVILVVGGARRARRVGAAMRRYGVDDALLQEARRAFQRPRPDRP